MTVLLWYLRYHTLEVEHFDDLDQAVGHASWLFWECKGAPQLIEDGDCLIKDGKLVGLISDYESRMEQAGPSPTPSVIGRIEILHPTEDVWVKFDSYTDAEDMASDVEWLKSVVGNARVSVVDP